MAGESVVRKSPAPVCMPCSKPCNTLDELMPAFFCGCRGKTYCPRPAVRRGFVGCCNVGVGREERDRTQSLHEWRAFSKLGGCIYPYTSVDISHLSTRACYSTSFQQATHPAETTQAGCCGPSCGVRTLSVSR